MSDIQHKDLHTSVNNTNPVNTEQAKCNPLPGKLLLSLSRKTQKRNNNKKKVIKIPMSNGTASAAGYVSVFMCEIIVNPACSMPKGF